MPIHKPALSLVFALALAGPVFAGNEASAAIEEAHSARYHGEYDRSLQIYERLAAGGHAEAAERAGFMLLQPAGSSDRGARRGIARATAWLQQAAAAGRPGAIFLLGMMDSAD
jgi:TPR repeat protein